MKSIKLGILIVGLLLICSCLVSAVNDYPVLTGYVNDYAGILSPQEQKLLISRIDSIERNTTVEIALVSVKTTNGEATSQYATKIGDKNGVGKKATDNGIVVLISFDNERGGFIATGKGIEGTLTDVKCSRIWDNSKTYFTDKRYYDGYDSILNGIEKEIDSGNTTASPSDTPDLGGKGIFLIIILIVVFVVFMIIVSVIGGSGGSGRYGGGGFSGGSFGGSSGGSDSGSSGGSFGGGGFGGGGSGGSF